MTVDILPQEPVTLHVTQLHLYHGDLLAPGVMVRVEHEVRSEIQMLVTPALLCLFAVYLLHKCAYDIFFPWMPIKLITLP